VLERQTQSWGNTGRVWQRHIIQQLRTTLEARIAKKWGKRVERTARYHNAKDSLRQEFRSDTELDELEATGDLKDSGGGHGRHQLQCEYGPNPDALVGSRQFQDPGEMESHVEEPNPEDRGNGFITTRKSRIYR